MITFPISGIETFWWLPMLVAFVISVLTSTGGVSGAFLILPFQVSFLGFTGPAVSSTNLVYNIIATPGGVYRYFKEGRMVWSLAWLIVLGTLPGLIIGAVIRVVWLLEPSKFKLFVGLVLLYLAGRLAVSVVKKTETTANNLKLIISDVKITLWSVELNFGNNNYRISTIRLLLLTLIVGIIGGAYGIGGGAIIAPFLVAVFGLPVYVVAGATLFGTFVSSITGVAIYYFLIPVFVGGQQPVSPDWLLGLSFGVGGLLGTYFGARLQRFLPSRTIKTILFLSIIYISIKYIGGYLF
jgi:uncharacterized membrane protein YfcA